MKINLLTRFNQATQYLNYCIKEAREASQENNESAEVALSNAQKAFCLVQAEIFNLKF